MKRVRGIAAGIGIAALMVIAMACGSSAPTVAGSIAPDLHLTSEGVEYNGAEIVGAVNTNGTIVCCGTQIDMDDMEVVAAGTIYYPDRDAGVDVYRPTTGATTDVYTFHPARRVEASGVPGGSYTSPATWTRWTAS